ncbi:MAG: hypothetical protein HYX23_01180 [Candidatus Zambryskibacteria bacterium]|nr:hypothetical protein [Candidatus Zambryskibacteria bacterium]
MRILITTGLKSSDVGGPAQYGPKLKEEFERSGHKAKAISYGIIERILPVGLRHLYFFLKILPSVIWANKIIALDTFSVGVPSVFASKLLGRKIIVRIGGDFLWSAYVNRTSSPITLVEFYQKMPRLNLKEKLVTIFLRFLINNASFLAFNTDWQRQIWKSHYGMEDKIAGVVRNFVPEKSEPGIPKLKNFLWAGRVIPEKNLGMIRRVANRIKSRHPDFRLDIVTGEQREHVCERQKYCYASFSAAYTDICPNFIIETVSFNKPFIMTAETGLNEIYSSGGIFLTPKHEKAWEDSIEAMLDYRVYNKLQEELASLHQEHSWVQIAREYIDIWKKV